MLSPLIAAGIIALCLFTSILSSITGMLGGVVLMAVLANILPVGAAMVLHGMVQFASNGYRAYLNRADIQWRIFLGDMVGSASALVLLSFLAYEPDRAIVLIGLGLLPFIALSVPQSLAPDITRRGVPVVAGFVVVVTNILAGVGGPILDIFYQRSALTRHQVVATKAATQTLAHSTKIIFYGVLVGVVAGESATGGVGNWPALWFFGGCVVMTFIGTRIGKSILDRIADATFFRWTRAILLSLGTLLLIRGIYLW